MDYDSDGLKLKIDELEREILNIKSAIRVHTMQIDENNRWLEMHKPKNKVQKRGEKLEKMCAGGYYGPA
jgi:hypothetical protein